MNNGQRAYVILLLFLATGLIFTGNERGWDLRVHPQAASAQVPVWPYPVITAANVAQLTEVEVMGQGWVSDATWSPDGSMLALAGAAGILLYDGETTDLNEPPRMRLDHPGGAVSVAFSPDSTWVASGGEDHTVRLWDSLTGEELAVLEGHANRVRSVAFSPGGKLLASGSSGYIPESGHAVLLWNISSEEISRVTEPHEPIFALSNFEASAQRLFFKSDGTQLWMSMVSVFSYTGVIWDFAAARSVETELLLRKVFDLNGSQVYMIDHVFSTHSDDLTTLSIREIDTLEEIAAWDTPPGWSIAVSPNGQWVATDERGYDSYSGKLSKMSAIRVWDAQTGELQTVLEETYTFPIKRMAFNPDGSRLIVLGNDKREFWANTILGVYEERTISLWDVNQGEKLSVLESWVRPGMAISPDGKAIAIPSSDGQHIEMRNLETGQVTLIESWGHEVAFSPDGNYLAAVEGDNIIRLWEIKTGKEVAHLEHVNSQTEKPRSIINLTFSIDGTRVLFGDKRNDRLKHNWLNIWNWQTDERLTLALLFCDSPYSEIEPIAVHPDGVHWVASGCESLQLGDLDKSGNSEIYMPDTLLRSESGSISSVLTFNPTGTLLAADGSDTVKVFNMSTQEILFELEVGERLEARCAAFSPDGRLLVVGIGAKIIVWDMQTRQQLTTLRGHADYVTDVAFSADGTFIASASRDGTVRLWAVSEGQ